MRIAIGQLWQETNTFNPIPTTWRDFEDFGILRGCDLVEKMAETNELGGFIQTLRQWPEPVEIVGLVRLPAWPSGTATRETFERIRAEIVESIHAAGPLDAVLLALHGSMVAEEHPDVEGDILEAVREVIGSSIPLVATLDLHANVTGKMVCHADVLVPYHTIPHIDVFETGCRAAKVLRRILDGGRPTMAFQKMPLVLPVERANTDDPSSASHEFRKELQRLETMPGVLAAGLFSVQPWIDVPELGSAVIVATENDCARAEKYAVALAASVWDRRRDYLPELVPVESAVVEATRYQEHGLVVLGDGADATTSGAPGDGTSVLCELLKHRWTRGALITMVSPELVADAQRIGVGGSRFGPVGGVRDHRYSKPLELTAKVTRLFDAQFVLTGHLGRNLPINMGPSAVFQCGDVSLIVTSRSGPHFAPELFKAAGFDPFSASVLVAKSPCGFRISFQSRAVKIISLRSPGCAPPDFWHYEYRNISRPLWPWDDTISFMADSTSQNGYR